MTIKEALLAEMDEVQVSDATLEKVIADKALAGTGEYNAPLHEKLVDLCYAAVLGKLLTRPAISEGGYSRGKLTNEDIKALVKGIYAKWNMVDPDTPKVRALHVR